MKNAVAETIALLDRGALRVAEKRAGAWVTNEWAKKAVLLSFRLEDNRVIQDGESRYYDKVPSKLADYTEETFRKGGFRVVPPAAVRMGSYIAKNVVLMPSFVNIGNASKLSSKVTCSNPVPSRLIRKRSKFGMPGFFELMFEAKMICFPFG